MIKKRSIQITIFLGMLLLLLPVYVIFNSILEKTKEVQMKKKVPSDWLFRQRAFPAGEINYDAYKLAWKQSQSLFNKMKSIAKITKDLLSIAIV